MPNEKTLNFRRLLRNLRERDELKRKADLVPELVRLLKQAVQYVGSSEKCFSQDGVFNAADARKIIARAEAEIK